MYIYVHAYHPIGILVQWPDMYCFLKHYNNQWMSDHSTINHVAINGYITSVVWILCDMQSYLLYVLLFPDIHAAVLYIYWHIICRSGVR